MVLCCDSPRQCRRRQTRVSEPHFRRTAYKSTMSAFRRFGKLFSFLFRLFSSAAPLLKRTTSSARSPPPCRTRNLKGLSICFARPCRLLPERAAVDDARCGLRRRGTEARSPDFISWRAEDFSRLSPCAARAQSRSNIEAAAGRNSASQRCFACARRPTSHGMLAVLEYQQGNCAAPSVILKRLARSLTPS